MTKLTETQTLILTRASARPGNLALPLPEGLHGAAAKMAIGRMIKRGWIEEVEANIRRGEPLWRETGDGHGSTLIATEAGLAAVGIDPVVSRAVASARSRAGTKQAAIIALLQRPEGASVAEIVAATGWLAHSVRGMISGALKKKLGCRSSRERSRAGERFADRGGSGLYPLRGVATASARCDPRRRPDDLSPQLALRHGDT